MTAIQYISQLGSAAARGATDLIPVTQGSAGALTGTTRKMTVAQLFTSPAFTGTTTLGNNLANYATVAGGSTGNAPTFTAAGSDSTIGLRFTPKNQGQIRFDGGILQNYTQTASGSVTKFITSDNTLNGTGGGAFSGNTFNINDRLDNGGADFYGHYFGMVLSSSYTGGRSNIRSLIQVNTAPTNPSKFYTGTNSTAAAGVNLNSGYLCAYTGEARLTSGGSAGLVEAMEIGAGILAGSSAVSVNVLKLSPLRDGIAPTTSFNGLALSSDGVGQQFFVGIAIGGAEAGGWPIATTGKIIAITNPSGSPAKTVDYGIDFATVPCTFTTAAFASPGFSVDGTGLTTTNGLLTNGMIILGSGGPRITTGSGAPPVVLSLAKGSLYIRVDGGVGSTIYVSQGGGTWNAIAGV